MSLSSLLKAVWNHPANGNARLAAIRRFASWQAYKRITGRPVTIDYHGLRLKVHPDSHSASKALYFSNLPDYREMRFILDYLRPGDRFVDVGANIGLYTLLAASIVGPLGHVHAFEPGKVPAKRLAEAISANGLNNVSIHRVAVSDRSGNAMFDPSADDCTARIASEQETKFGNIIATVRLDEYLPAGSYAMIKLDIEGHEPFAIRGAKEMLINGNPPVLQLELAGYSKNYGISTPEIIGELDSLGFECAYYEPDAGSLTATNRPWEVPVEDVLGVSRRQKTFVARRLAQTSPNHAYPRHPGSIGD